MIGSCLTLTEAVDDLPSADAVIVAVPNAPLVIAPALVTLAIEPLLDDQETVRPVRTLPLASLSVADI
jgi:hypothetical protein